MSRLVNSKPRFLAMRAEWETIPPSCSAAGRSVRLASDGHDQAAIWNIVALLSFAVDIVSVATEPLPLVVVRSAESGECPVAPGDGPLWLRRRPHPEGSRSLQLRRNTGRKIAHHLAQLGPLRSPSC
jgi:hypothetical protein